MVLVWWVGSSSVGSNPDQRPYTLLFSKVILAQMPILVLILSLHLCRENLSKKHNVHSIKINLLMMITKIMNIPYSACNYYHTDIPCGTVVVTITIPWKIYEMRTWWRRNETFYDDHNVLGWHAKHQLPSHVNLRWQKIATQNVRIVRIMFIAIYTERLHITAVIS